MTFGTDLQDMASTLLSDLGTQVTFNVRTDSHDPISGAVTVSGTTTYDVYVSWGSYDKELINGTTVQADDARVIVAAKNLGFTPTILMTITAFGKTWSVVSINTIVTQDVIVAYDVQARS